MWKCEDCGSHFEFPEIKRPDSGLVPGLGILGIVKLSPIKFCPTCFSTLVKRGDGNE